MSPNAEEMKANAEAAAANAAKKAKKEKSTEIAELTSPSTKIPDCIRGQVRKYVGDTGRKFAQITLDMWVEMLKAKKYLAADFVMPANARTSGGGSSSAAKEEILMLKAELYKATKNPAFKEAADEYAKLIADKAAAAK